MCEPTFVDRLRSLVAPEKVRGADRDAGARSHDETEELVRWALGMLDLPSDPFGLSVLRKGDWRKVLVSVLLRGRTAVCNRWLSERLAMGHAGAVSRLIGGFGKDKSHARKMKELEEML